MQVAPEAFLRIIQHKEAGNALFSSGKIAEAREAYQSALAIFGDSPLSELQRAEKVKLHSNLALCCIKLELWRAAHQYASDGLAVDIAGQLSEKLRYRRACAASKLGDMPDEIISDCDWLLNRDGHSLHAAARKMKQEATLSKNSALHAGRLPRWKPSCFAHLPSDRVEEIANLQITQTFRVAMTRAAACGTYEVSWKKPGSSFNKLDAGKTIMNIPPGCTLRIRWHDPQVDPATLPPNVCTSTEDLMSHPRPAGTVECEFYDAAALAMEFHTIASATSFSDFKHLDGGLLYLIGEPHLFWCSVLHFAAFSSCAPPFPPDAALRGYEDSVYYQEFSRIHSELSSQYMAKEPPPGSAVVCQSRMQAIVVEIQLLQEMKKTACVADQQLMYRKLPWGREHHGAHCHLPTREAELPQWWVDAVQPWDRVMKIMFDGRGEVGSVPCMFYATKLAPGGIGCLAPPGYDYSRCSVRPCPCHHDNVWFNHAEDMRKHPRICICGAYASQACLGCREKFFCGNCPETLGVIGCNKCLSEGKVHESDAMVTAGDERCYHRSSMMPGGVQGVACTPQSCAHCGATEGNMRRCANCKITAYCSRACQQAAWPAHKKSCSVLKKEREEAQGKGRPEIAMHTDATGVGSVALLHNPAGESRMMLLTQADMLRMLRAPKKQKELVFRQVTDLESLPLQFLLSCGMRPNLPLAQSLLPAILDMGDITKLLLPGAGFTALDWAARKGNYEIAEWLATAEGTKELVNTGAPVGWACYTNRVELASMLVGHRADPAATNEVLWGGMPPLLVAAENGQLLAMKWLVEEQGQNIQMKDEIHGGVLQAVERACSGSVGRDSTQFSMVQEMLASKSSDATMNATSPVPGVKACATWARQRIHRDQLAGARARAMARRGDAHTRAGAWEPAAACCRGAFMQLHKLPIGERRPDLFVNAVCQYGVVLAELAECDEVRLYAERAAVDLSEILADCEEFDAEQRDTVTQVRDAAAARAAAAAEKQPAAPQASSNSSSTSPSKVCIVCRLPRQRSAFSKRQWGLKLKNGRRCNFCTENSSTENRPRGEAMVAMRGEMEASSMAESQHHPEEDAEVHEQVARSLVKGATVKYKPTGEQATILVVHSGDVPPHYTIALDGGGEKQTTAERLEVPKEDEEVSMEPDLAVEQDAVEQGDECPICFDICSPDIGDVALPCDGQHRVCIPCMQDWSKERGTGNFTCPTCRAAIPETFVKKASASYLGTIRAWLK